MAAHRYWSINVLAVQGGTNIVISQIQLRNAINGPTQNWGPGSSGITNVNHGGPPFEAFDGNAGTIWEASLPAWCGWYFGAQGAQVVFEVKITAGNNIADNTFGPGSFTIDYSVDGTGWQTAVSQTGVTWTSGQSRTYATGITAAYKYWRVYTTATSGGSTVIIGDIELHATSGGPNLTSNSATASSTGTGISGFAGSANAMNATSFTNIATTGVGWQSASNITVARWQFDFGALITENIIEFAMTATANTLLGPLNTSPTSFTLDYSDDGVNWTTLQPFTASWTVVPQTQIFTLAPQSPIKFVGAEDFNFTFLAYDLSGSVLAAALWSIDTTATRFRAGFSRYALTYSATNAAVDNISWMRTNSNFNLTEFWLTARGFMHQSTGAGPNASICDYLRFVDSSGIVRLRIRNVAGQTTGSGNFMVQTVTSAGVATQIGSNSTSGLFTLDPGTANKIDIYINYLSTASGRIIIYKDGVQVFNFTGNITTDSATAIAFIDFGQFTSSTNIGFVTSGWSEMMVSTRDTRLCAGIVTRVSSANGNTHNFTGGAAANVNPNLVNDASPDYSTSEGEIQEYTVTPNVPTTFNVLAVIHSMRLTGTESTAPTGIDCVIRSGGVDNFSLDIAGNTAWNLQTYNWNYNPTFNRGWQPDDLNNAGYNFGYRSVGFIFSTWNPADISQVTISNLLLTYTSVTFVGGVRTINGYLAGKRYFEVTFTTATASDTGVGISIAGASFSNLATNGTNGAIMFHFGSGAIYINGTNTITGAPIVNGTVVGVAVDLDNKLIWWTADGTHWNSTSSITNDPATGVGGQSFSALTGPFFATGLGGGSNNSGTLNAGASAFNYTVPNGFIRGW